MSSATALSRRAAAAVRVDWVLPTLITAAAVFIYVNGALFSTFGALHVDLSINLTAAHAIRNGDNPYGETRLLDLARELGSPPKLGTPEPVIYRTLFTSYIQPPPSALSVLPLTFLSWRDGTRVYLILSNLALAGAVVLTLRTVPPAVPTRWAVAGAAVIVAAFSQIYASFALGQVDAIMTLLLAAGLWGYSRDKPAVAGSAIAAATAIKLIPAALILYFLWRREYRVVLWALGAGAALFLLSLAAVGTGTYWSYFSDTLPGLMKGSTQYANISISGEYTRWFVGQFGALGALLSLEEVPFRPAARILSLLTIVALLGAFSFCIPRSPLRRPGRAAGQFYVTEYYLVVATALLVSSVTWEFYVIWLLPFFLAAFLAPARVLPGGPLPRWLLIAALVVVFAGLNYPGGRVGREYFFDVNSLFYHPEWVPGAWVEEHVFALYGAHLTLVPVWRLAALILLTTTLFAAAFERGRGSFGRRL
jgi:hypothetical protein